MQSGPCVVFCEFHEGICMYSYTHTHAHTQVHSGVHGRVKQAAAAFLYGGLCLYVCRSTVWLSGLPACESKHGGVGTSPYLFNTEIGVTVAGLQQSSARHNWLRNDNKHSQSVVPANLLVFSQSWGLTGNTGRLTQSVFRFLSVLFFT